MLQGQPLHPLNMLCNCLQMHQKKAGALQQSHRKGNLVPSRKQATHKLPGTKGSLLDLPSAGKTVLIATDNTTVVAYMNKEGG